jgi:hypothetical protein
MVVWTTQDGRKFKLGEMAESHVKNTIGYFSREERNVKSHIDTLCEGLDGDAPAYHQEAFAESLEEAESQYDQYRLVVLLMKKELRRRDEVQRAKQEKLLPSVRRSARIRENIRKKQAAHRVGW